MEKKLCISLIFSNFVVSKHKVIIFHAMHNLYANFVKILEICKNFSINLVKMCIRDRFSGYQKVKLYPIT